MTATTTAELDLALVEGEENGWHLRLEAGGGCYDFRLPHEVAVALNASMAAVREHEAEGQAALREYRAALPYGGLAYLLREDDDPHEAARHAADLANKARKENP